MDVAYSLVGVERNEGWNLALFARAISFMKTENKTGHWLERLRQKNSKKCLLESFSKGV